MKAIIALLILISLSSCASKTSCTANPGADIDLRKGETIQEKVTPKATISCNF
jgi:hypothetical protein